MSKIIINTKGYQMNTIVITSLIAVLSACSMPHIENNNNTLQITQKDKSSIKGTGKLMYESRVNLVDIDVQQKVYLMDNGSVLTYEDAPVSTGYVYSYGMRRTIGIIFPQYSYDLIDTKANIYFFKLYSKTDTEYLILEHMNKKRIKLVYGLSESVFQSIFDSLVNDKKMPNSIDVTSQKILDDKSLYIKSRWNSKNLILDGIITKMGGRAKLGM